MIINSRGEYELARRVVHVTDVLTVLLNPVPVLIVDLKRRFWVLHEGVRQKQIADA
jgi:hypothetical protein